jgi:hypothetical protein
MVLPLTLRVTGGLCMPCHKRQEREKRERQAELQRQADIDAAIEIQHPEAEIAFLDACAAHCQLDCCGFGAIAMTEEQFRQAANSCGSSVAAQALAAMRDHIRQIGEHRGLVKVFGAYEPADETRNNYALCASLIMQALHPRSAQYNEP